MKYAKDGFSSIVITIFSSIGKSFRLMTTTAYERLGPRKGGEGWTEEATGGLKWAVAYGEWNG